jgi:hypothetical protein
MYARFARELGPFLNQRLTLAEAQSIVRRRLDAREENFLATVERAVYGWPGSPYLPLLRRAGCDLADLRASVRTRGLEASLLTLRAEGVYVTFDEFKGRAPIVRDGVERATTAHDFDNPFAARHVETTTGGSTGAGTRIAYDLRHFRETYANEVVSRSAHGLHDLPSALWRPILPASTGRDLRGGVKYPLAMSFVVGLLRARGYRPPRPEPVPLDRAIVVGRWAWETVRAEGAAVVRTSISMGLRAALAAADEGLDLTGVTFAGGGEPATPAKVRGITRTGARFVTRYGMSEGGSLGPPCARPLDPTDVHLCDDVWALVQHPRQMDGGGATVDAFCFTSLLPTAPKLMLNVETDDYGIVETRSCGCPLEEAGWRRHIREIRSYKKLTGEGMTLVGNDMLHVLEDVLPSRFGGSALDWQLREDEDERGFTRLTIVVSPRVGPADESAIVETVLEGLSRAGAGADLTGAIWRQAGTLRVERTEPVWTGAGKLMPFRKVAAA